VVAHRGASDAYPENTLCAFRAALDAGAQLVELDVHTTRDGALVCIHDATCDRTTDSTTALGRTEVAVADTDLADVLRLDAGSWKDPRFRRERIPTLRAALATIHAAGGVAMIEHKAGTPGAMHAEIRELGLVDDVVVQSFDWDWLALLHAAEPRIAIAALAEEPFTPGDLPRLARTGASIAHYQDRALGLADVATLHAAGYLVAVWTVDAEIAWLGAAHAGVDPVTTNRPERAIALSLGRPTRT